MPKTIMEYWIYKMTQGVKYPGEAWEGPLRTQQVAEKRLSEAYDDNFCVVLTTHIRLPKTIRR